MRSKNSRICGYNSHMGPYYPHMRKVRPDIRIGFWVLMVDIRLPEKLSYQYHTNENKQQNHTSKRYI